MLKQQNKSKKNIYKNNLAAKGIEKQTNKW